MTLFWRKNLVKIIIALLSISSVVLLLIYFPQAVTLKPSELGVVSFISSLPTETQKQEAALKAKEAGFGWFREEYTYNDPMNYAPYNAAYQHFTDADLNILGLLTHPGPAVSHAQWQNYVSEVVKNYPKVKAWEIMNEADNYLSAADYVTYLKEARAAIKAQSDAPVICSGLTARGEAYQFWADLKAAGGWDDCDALGLHLYHIGDPTKDNGGGTLFQEAQAGVDNIGLNGGGKRIWITEFGYNSEQEGAQNQADWLTQGLSILQQYDEIERIFVYRLYDHGDGFGVLDENLTTKESFTAIKDWLASGAPALVPNQATAESTAAPPSVDKAKSYLRLDGEKIAPDGKEQFRVVVGLKDTQGETIKDQKPDILLSGGQTISTEPVIVGEEWFVYVASTELGERTADIKVGTTELGTLKMVFGAETVPAGEPPPTKPPTLGIAPNQTVTTPEAMNAPSVTKPQAGLEWFIVIESIILILIIIVVWKLIQRSRA